MKLKLIVIGGKKAGMEVPISRPKFLIGRGDDCHLRPQSQLVSRRHCVISTDNSSATIEDCGSATGTLVNGEKVQQRRGLKNSDRIKIGPLELEVRLEAVPATEPHAKHERHNGQVTCARTPREDILDGEADFLGWLDGKNNGANQNIGLPVARRITAKPVLHPQLEDNISDNESTYSLEGDGNGKGYAISHASDKSDDLTTVAFPRNVDRLLRDSPQQVGGLHYSKPANLNLVEAEAQAKEEWDGTDLLLLAALGILLVVVLSWMFPMSWPENFSLSAWMKRCLQVWWQKWWLRWGAVAILMGLLIKLLCIRARSEKHG